MRHLFLLAALACLFTGCGERPAQPSLKTQIKDATEKQRTAFVAGTCSIRQAWHYTGPVPYAERSTNFFLGLVVELCGFTDHFDFDDIDLIDADSGVNLRGDPEIWPLKADGMADAGAYEFPKAPGPVTVFLLYERDIIPKRIKLEYWGKAMVTEPAAVAPEGKAMFKPSDLPRGKGTAL